MRTFSAPVLAALAGSELALVTLVKLEFPSGTIALNSSNYHLTWSGTTYLAAAGLGRVSPINDSPFELPGANLELLRVDSSYISLALDDADEVQGSPVTISTAIIDPATLQILDVETDWAGYADTMGIDEDGDKATISLSAECKGVDLLRGTPLTYSDGDQQSLFPGDRAFEYVPSQADQPVVWPKREWFFR